MSVLQNPEMPKSLLGIQGLSLWNILMLNILIAWYADRKRQGWEWDFPPGVKTALIVYATVMIIAFIRLSLDFGRFKLGSYGFAVSEYLINCFKWTLPGMLLFDGCRTRKRKFTALVTILVLHVALALIVIKNMPIGLLSNGAKLSERAARVLQKRVGYHRVSLSMILGGGSWAVLACVCLTKRRLVQLGLMGLAFIILVGQALTGGRGGYVTWGIIGLIFGILRYRKILLAIPIVCIAVAIFMPGVVERLTMGVGGTQGGVVMQNDVALMTSGRGLIWPLVIEEIKKAPILGDGRKTFSRHNMQERLGDATGDYQFPHPHNAYLEFMLDNGIVGLLLIAPFYFLVIKHALRLFLVRDDPLCAALGGACIALVASLLISAFGSMSFYPVDDVVGMWGTIGLVFRMSVDRDQGIDQMEEEVVEEDQDLSHEYST